MVGACRGCKNQPLSSRKQLWLLLGFGTAGWRFPKMRALIVEDGLSRQALAAARALREGGWVVGVGSPKRSGCVAAGSSAVSEWHAVPTPETSLNGFLDGVVAATSAGHYDIVFGARDFEVAALSYHRQEIGAAIPHAPHERVIQAQDKVELMELGRRAGFAVPEIAADAKEALARWPIPIVVKPRVGAALDQGLRSGRLPGRSGAALAHDAGAVERAVNTIEAARDEPVFQQGLSGRLIAMVVLADADSRVVACVQQRAERTWPRDAGISVRARTTPVDESLRERAQALVSALDWYGIAQLQLLVGDDGEPRLIDFNGRFYGSLALMLGAGVNLPAAWGQMALGQPLSSLPEATLGVRYQWLWGDLRRAGGERRGGLLADVVGSLRYAPGATHSVSSLRDPLPAARYLGIRLRQRAARG